MVYLQMHLIVDGLMLMPQSVFTDELSDFLKVK